MQIVEPQPSGDDHQPTGYLHHELGTVTDAYQVIGHTDQIEYHDGTESESQGTAFLDNSTQHVAVAQELAHTEQQRNGEEHDRLEGDTAQTGNDSLVDLALVGHVE